MDFRFTPEEEAFREELVTFLEESLPPDWSGGDFPADVDEDWEFTLTMRKKLAQKGWLAMHWPQEYGGLNASIMTQVVFNEEMSYRRAPGFDQFGIRMMGSTLLIHGNDEQKQRFLPPVARGEVQWCQGYSEPGSGSDLASLQTSAVEDGDDFVINGSKIWTSLAHRADWMIVLARTDVEAPKHRGISFFLVDMKTPGITVTPITNMAGIHTFNQVFFEDVRVPKPNIVGEQNRGWYVGATLLDFERSGIQYSASSRRTLEEMVTYAKETERNGKLLMDDPVISNRLAELAVEVEVSRMISYHIAWMQSQGLVPNMEASTGKLFGTELQQRIAAMGVDLLGLYGQLAHGSKWAPLEGRLLRSYLTSFSATLAAGTSEIQRNIIATRGLGLPRG
jgi:alkylation response protein AidB-like acyl-CoA dehydrogenase